MRYKTSSWIITTFRSLNIECSQKNHTFVIGVNYFNSDVSVVFCFKRCLVKINATIYVLAIIINALKSTKSWYTVQLMFVFSHTFGKCLHHTFYVSSIAFNVWIDHVLRCFSTLCSVFNKTLLMVHHTIGY